MAVTQVTETFAGTATSISGKGPLPIFFDSSGTNATGIAKPYQQLDFQLQLIGGYLNNFGNKPSLDVSRMYGPMLPTVWEADGTALLTVRDPFNAETIQTLYTIIVDNDWTTGVFVQYVDPDAGNDSNDGLTTSTAKLTWLPAYNALLANNGPRALYLKRGITKIQYGGTAGQKVSQFGDGGVFGNVPTLISTYGSGATPIVETDGRGCVRTRALGTGAPLVSDPPAGQDIRIIDITFEKTSAGSSDPALSLGLGKSLYLRCGVAGTYNTGWSNSGDGLNGGVGDHTQDLILADCTQDVAASDKLVFSATNFTDVDKTWKRNGFLACKFKTLSANTHGIRCVGHHTAYYDTDIDWMTASSVERDGLRINNTLDVVNGGIHQYLYIFGGSILATQTGNVEVINFHSETGNRFHDALLVGPKISMQGQAQSKMINITFCDDFWIKSAVLVFTNGAVSTSNYDGIYAAGNNANVVILSATVHSKSNVYLFRNAGFATTGLRVEGVNFDDTDGVSGGKKIIDHGSGLLAETTVKNCNLRSDPINKILVAGNGYDIAGWDTAKGGSQGNDEIDPLFVDRVNGDYHLQTGSTLIDAILVSNTIKEIFQDRDGLMVPFDGNNNGTAEQDIGAFEFNSILSPLNSVMRLTALGLVGLIRTYGNIDAKPAVGLLTVVRRRGMNATGSSVGVREVQYV